MFQHVEYKILDLLLTSRVNFRNQQWQHRDRWLEEAASTQAPGAAQRRSQSLLLPRTILFA